MDKRRTGGLDPRGKCTRISVLMDSDILKRRSLFIKLNLGFTLFESENLTES